MEAMAQGTFKKAGKAKKRLYGQRGLMVCGYPPDEHQPLLMLLEQNTFQDLPVIFATDGDLSKALKEVFSLENRVGLGKHSDMQRAIIMSGFTQKELHLLMATYRVSEMPPTLWATLTPISENWSLSQLLGELAAEAEARKRQKEGVKSYTHRRK
jgi:hypothetical protein